MNKAAAVIAFFMFLLAHHSAMAQSLVPSKTAPLERTPGYSPAAAGGSNAAFRLAMRFLNDIAKGEKLDRAHSSARSEAERALKDSKDGAVVIVEVREVGRMSAPEGDAPSGDFKSVLHTLGANKEEAVQSFLETPRLQESGTSYELIAYGKSSDGRLNWDYVSSSDILNAWRNIEAFQNDASVSREGDFQRKAEVARQNGRKAEAQKMEDNARREEQQRKETQERISRYRDMYERANAGDQKAQAEMSDTLEKIERDSRTARINPYSDVVSKIPPRMIPFVKAKDFKEMTERFEARRFVLDAIERDLIDEKSILFR